MNEEISFGALNYSVLFLYLCVMVLIGLFLAGKQKTTQDYFLAGRRMPWIVVSMSLFASLTSAISYMGVPGLAYAENISFFVGIWMLPISAPFIIYLFLPFYRQLNVTTSYEYIHRRFGQPARFFVAWLFILARIGWLGTVLYAPALALSVVTGIGLWTAITIMGLLGTLYTALGGLAAVLWTDVVQFLILVGGAIWVAISLSINVPDGVIGIFQTAQEAGRLNLMDWRPSLVEMTVVVVCVSYFCQFLHDYGVDQVTVQRLLATPDLSGMVRATVTNALFSVVIFGILGFIGLGLLAYTKAHEGQIPPNLDPDSIFPYYIVHALPVGVSGLVITGIFAAAMSSVDSGINSVTSVIMNDFILPLRKSVVPEAYDVSLSRGLTMGLGAFATLTGYFASTLGNIVQVSQTFLGLFTGPVLGLFLLGILTKRGTFGAWVVGAAIAVPGTFALRYAEIHFVWYFPFSFAVSFGIGYLLSWTMTPSTKGDVKLTIWDLKEDRPSRN